MRTVYFDKVSYHQHACDELRNNGRKRNAVYVAFEYEYENRLSKTFITPAVTR